MKKLSIALASAATLAAGALAETPEDLARGAEASVTTDGVNAWEAARTKQTSRQGGTATWINCNHTMRARYGTTLRLAGACALVCGSKRTP